MEAIKIDSAAPRGTNIPGRKYQANELQEQT